MHILERKIEINAPVKKVWEVLTDIESYPKWQIDKKEIKKLEPNKYFDGQRSALKEGMKYGVCEVTIPIKVHKHGSIERPGVVFPDENPKQHIVIKTLDVLEWGTFVNNINQHISKTLESGG